LNTIGQGAEDSRLLDDGFGNIWEKCLNEDCALEIVRPGKVQCVRCQYEDEEPLPRVIEGKVTPC
jgi:hypothetical protein